MRVGVRERGSISYYVFMAFNKRNILNNEFYNNNKKQNEKCDSIVLQKGKLANEHTNGEIERERDTHSAITYYDSILFSVHIEFD